MGALLSSSSSDIPLFVIDKEMKQVVELTLKHVKKSHWQSCFPRELMSRYVTEAQRAELKQNDLDACLILFQRPEALPENRDGTDSGSNTNTNNDDGIWALEFEKLMDDNDPLVAHNPALSAATKALTWTAVVRKWAYRRFEWSSVLAPMPPPHSHHLDLSRFEWLKIGD